MVGSGVSKVVVDALTDGLMLIRAMFGLTEAAVTSKAIGGNNPTRTTWAQIRPFLDCQLPGEFRAAGLAAVAWGRP